MSVWGEKGEERSRESNNIHSHIHTPLSSLKCPECDSHRIYKDGLRSTNEGQIQRFLCRDCGYRFSNNPYKQSQTNRNYQLCVILKEAKKLAAQEIEKICAGDGNLLNYAWLLKKKHGLADNTISLRVKTLRLIQKKGVNLLDPDSFETALATESLTKARKWQW